MNVLIFGMVNASNLGDPIIYECLASKIKRRGHNVLSCDFGGYERKLEVTLNAGAEDASVRRSSWLKSKIGSHPELAARLNRLRWIFKVKDTRERYLSRIVNADVILIGGGQLLTDIYYGLPARFYELHKVLVSQKKRYWIALCGAGNKFSESGALVYKNLIESSDGVILRGEDSLISVKAISPIYKNFDVCVDPAFACSKEFKFPATKRKNTLGFCYQGFRTLAMHKRSFSSLGRHGIEGAVKNIIEQFVLAGYCVDIFTNGDCEDYIEARDFYSKYFVGNEAVCLSDRPEGAVELVKKISVFDRVIAFRMHAAIVAYSYGAKVINFAWDDKVREVWRCFGAEEVVAELVGNHESGTDWVARLESVHFDQAKVDKANKNVELLMDRVLR